jgi:hypothetical protein
VSRKRVRLPLGMLGQVVERSAHGWVWRCFIAPCPAEGWRREPQLSREAAEDVLVAHLRNYHSATGGEPRARESPRQR